MNFQISGKEILLPELMLLLQLLKMQAGLFSNPKRNFVFSSCSVIIRVSVVLKRTVGDSD